MKTESGRKVDIFVEKMDLFREIRGRKELI